MDTLVIHPIDQAQQKALEAILDGFKIPYDIAPATDETEYLTSTKANKNRLDAALKNYQDGKGVEIKTEDLWK